MAGGSNQTGTTTGVSTTLNDTLKKYPDRDPVIQESAEKYGIPYNILEGVWGMETDFGQNVQTSSAGAVGPFQFIPATAKSYNYPLTNNPTAAQYRQQSDAAAHYLSDLYKQKGNWDDALHGYSGGGYGLDEVVAKAKHSNDTPILPDSLHDAYDSVTGAVSDAVSLPQKFYDLVTDITLYIRLFEAIFGGLLVYFGLKQLTGE